jgi:F-type H+-transporting ATPase subunit epsilon
MADRLQFELVSPEKLVLSEMVEMVVVPGAEGNFGVLPGHSLFLSMVRPGVIEVYEGKDVTERLFVAGGFAEVTPERCTVLADEALPLTALDGAAIEADLRTLEGVAANLRERVGKSSGDERDELLAELADTETRLAVANAKLAVLRSGVPVAAH